jgi:hypothetical protein
VLNTRSVSAARLGRLCPPDSWLRCRGAKALAMSELQELLDHVVRAQRVVVFIDACHSAGVAGTRLVTGRQLERVENNVFNLDASKLYRDTGRAVLTSSDLNEISEEGTNWGGGHGASGVTQNRPYVVTSKPANENSR